MIQNRAYCTEIGKTSLSSKSVTASLIRMPAIHQTLNPGVTIVHQGRLVHDVCILQSGFVKLQQITGDGNYVITEIIAPGHALGIESILQNVNSSYSAISMTACTIQSIPRGEFCVHCSSDRSSFCDLHKQYSLRCEQFRNRCLTMASTSYSKQLVACLSPLLSDEQIRTGVRPIPLSQREIASMLFVSPEHLSRLLTALEKRGIIFRFKRQMYFGPALSKKSLGSTHGAVPIGLQFL